MKLGVIGGSGLYDIDGLEDIKEINLETPFGNPSDSYITGNINANEIVFLPRHARGHKILPNELNHKANIWGMKKLGVTHILSISAVGSLKEELVPRDVVIVDQYFDRTKSGLEHTFFGEGIVAHIPFADPICPEMKELVFDAAKAACEIHNKNDNSSTAHLGGIYINMEGPAFSTKAESKIYKSWGLDVIGMTNLPEAKLAKEAEICYITAAMVTDYDAWHSSHDSVTLDMVIANLTANANLAKNIIRIVLETQKELKEECGCSSTLSTSLVTPMDLVPDKTKEKLNLIIKKYL